MADAQNSNFRRHSNEEKHSLMESTLYPKIEPAPIQKMAETSFPKRLSFEVDTVTEELVRVPNGHSSAHEMEKGDSEQPADVTKTDSSQSNPDSLLYKVDEVPPWHLTIMFGLQITVTNLSAFLVISTIISDNICADQDFKSRIFQTSAVMTGITSIAQAIFGVRLPVFQGPAVAGVLPFIDAATDPRWRCNMNVSNAVNVTGMEDGENNWDDQWKKIQGSMLIGSIFVTLVGLTGLGSLIGRIIRPISITVLFLLLGVYVWKMVASLAEVNWGVAIFSMVVVVICSQFIAKYEIPFPTWKRGQGLVFSRLPIFQLFSVFISILLTWLFCFILTVSGALPDDPEHPSYQARTDIYTDDIREAPVFRVPYPGQFGPMGFDLNYSIHYIPIMLTLIIDLIADCHQYAVVCEVPPPPNHAVNRGIMTLGIGAILSSAFGAGHPTSSYGNMMGVIKVTRVGSRAASIAGGIIVILIGIFGKFGAVLVAIPKPVLFGPAFLGISFLIGTAFENLKYVNVSARRNQCTLGMAMFFGVVLPFWIDAHPDALDTGSKLADDVIIGILRIPFLIGVLVAAFLDIALPGGYSGLRTLAPDTLNWLHNHGIKI